MINPSVERRFWSRVSKLAEGECWEWVGAVNNQGYGVLFVANGNRHRNAMQYAHRLSFEMHNGSITDRLFVCHRCDNRKCVNPSHLFLGTQVDNMQDCSRKGRVHRVQPTHCKNGHEFSEENTYRYQHGGFSHRGCRTCRAEANRRFHAKQ